MPTYVGYGNAVAERGFVGATVDHGLRDFAAYPRAAKDVAAAVDLARNDPRVDQDRVALWFFSAGGLLLADWLRDPPRWLRCVGASYPILAPRPGRGIDPRFSPADAVAAAGQLPVILTTAGRERDEIAVTVPPFIKAAREANTRLEVIDVPDGQHGFDQLDHTEQSIAAVERAIEAVLAPLR
ncbi:alpha/beta hydrolase [Amycolatopsis sp. CA-230715]|uniref:alpha/beta hydrolase n=1 Tax=Amycolatopsis sp. CA-230715 TaxID=2745196 RepID=UPI001C024235|nr:dienelactone hydrolase family protein [Amycolatopsis sp. CA-230715]QWF82974.1 hypothetical protein HUW46_06413 [Amycolatopsis sp. CA-230715]